MRYAVSDFLNAESFMVAFTRENADWQVLDEYTWDGESLDFDRRYVYGNYIDEVLLMNDGSNDYYYAHDHLYSPVALTLGGNVVERYEYDAYGYCHIKDASYGSRTTSLYGNTVAFTGRTLDVLDNGNLKLMYYRNRYYDTYTGRMLTADPAGYVDGFNLYEYVVSNPIILLDPLGLWPWTYYPDRTEAQAKQAAKKELEKMKMEWKNSDAAVIWNSSSSCESWPFNAYKDTNCCKKCYTTRKLKNCKIEFEPTEAFYKIDKLTLRSQKQVGNVRDNSVLQNPNNPLPGLSAPSYDIYEGSRLIWEGEVGWANGKTEQSVTAKVIEVTTSQVWNVNKFRKGSVTAIMTCTDETNFYCQRKEGVNGRSIGCLRTNKEFDSTQNFQETLKLNKPETIQFRDFYMMLVPD